ncbi:hypothetical protein LX77_02891 [Gelidibacter algens]|uniref:Uncharacterized protein n=1 Tax=Gelidibacter algens TaxID=49280 RepID=A0A1A7QQD7_9FLAO|nr:hypothetical protein [Gelidibacter algens]OBX21543.1 hypothetical protein A9996_18005 [Gelidibacter algens]RAJ21137.1 hypothetical protein LX77_02891 [Gelidibacter algens]
MNDIDTILSDNYTQLDKLKLELQQIAGLRDRIQDLKDSNEKLPEEFQRKFQLIIEHATQYNESLGSSVRLFVDGNNDLLVKNINEIKKNVSQLQEINIDFRSEITRLSDIDLESHFNNHQGKLSEVFISVNGINGVIASISQNINKIFQNFGDIEQTLSKNQKDITKKFDSLTEEQKSSAKELLNKLKESDDMLNSIISQNNLLNKRVEFNKKLSFGIIAFVIIAIVILLIKI